MELEELKSVGSAPIGRRRVLQGVAIGGALWAAPSVLTLDRASAATGSALACGPFNCNAEGPSCDGNPDCFCGALVGGGTACTDPNQGFCLPDGQLCTTDADCVNQNYGTICLELVPGCGACGSASTFCSVPCDAAAADTRSRSQSLRRRGAGIQPVSTSK